MPLSTSTFRVSRRVCLRRLRAADLPQFQAYRTDVEVARWQGWEIQSDADALAFLRDQAVVDLLQPGIWCQIAIAARGDDRLIGDIGICVQTDGRRAEIGYTLTPAEQGSGLATEAVAEALQWVFETTTVEAVIGLTLADNEASIRLLERVGMRRAREITTDPEEGPEWEYVMDRED